MLQILNQSLVIAKQVLLFNEPSPQPLSPVLHTFIINILILKAATYLKIMVNNTFLMTVLYSRYSLEYLGKKSKLLYEIQILDFHNYQFQFNKVLTLKITAISWLVWKTVLIKDMKVLNVGSNIL